MNKATRTSTITYKNRGSELLKVLHMKCASVDHNTKLRAKMAFINCRIQHDETAINFLTRLEQKANEARNYDIRISEQKFIWVLLNNMKHHSYYKERIASFLTTFELNPSSISQRWIENKFYSIDEERILNFRRKFRENARFTNNGGFQKSKYEANSNKCQNISSQNKPEKQCKYCYRKGHIDTECFDKKNKRPPSMPDWVSSATCEKCKRKGHLSFNCPPKYDNKKRKFKKSFFKQKSHNNEKFTKTDKTSNFAGTTTHTTDAGKSVEFAGAAYFNREPMSPWWQHTPRRHTFHSKYTSYNKTSPKLRNRYKKCNKRKLF